MSMNAMQLVLCRGIVDAAFRARLMEAPQAALAEYELTEEEHAVFTSAPSRSLVGLASAVDSWRRGDLVRRPEPVHVPALALAG